jgi:uncharacterized protein YgiM (DUF1202 family)
MKNLIKVSMFLLISLCVVSALNAGVQGIVTANTLNVRVKPSTNYAVVAKLKKDDKVFIVNHKKEWYEVSVPDGTKVYVASPFIKDGKIVKEVNLRSGPSVAFSAFRLASPEESIKVINTANPDWVQIEPSNPVTAWVSSKYIFVTPENLAKLEKELKAADQPVEVISEAITESTLEDITGINAQDESKAVEEVTEVKQNIKVDAKPDTVEPLPFLDSPPKKITIEGVVVKCTDDAKYVNFALASRVNGKLFPLCYLHSDNPKLKTLLGRRVLVSGLQRWVKNWERPVLEVEEIKASDM